MQVLPLPWQRLNKEFNMTENNELENIPENIEIPEPEIIPNPWDNAPTDVYFYEKIYDDGHLGSFTQSAELAYKSGWDIENNYIAIEDTQQSDINGWTYRKDVCPMKTEEDLLKDQYRLEITQLKKLLSDTDYKAIKFAEGQISEDEYSEIKSERQGYRDRINYLEGLL